jgi:hypothetical protein
MNKYIIRALLSALIFAFLSCSENNGPQVIENSNNERHIFVLEQGQSFNYDLAKIDNNTDPSKDTSLKVFRKTKTSIGSKTLVSGKTANVINNNEFLNYTIFQGATHFSSTEEGLELFFETLPVGDTVKTYLNDIWLKVIDFDELEWEIASGVDTVFSSTVNTELEYRIFGKRINVADVIYNRESYDGLSIEITIWVKKTELDTFNDPIIKTKKTSILSIGGIGIYQLKTLTNRFIGEFHFSVLSDDDL